MKIIIVGIGKLGEYLVKNLVKDGNEVTLVDTDFTTSMDVINNEDVNYILGSGLDANVLTEAGIKDSDLLISVMQHDEQNVMCSLLGKKLGAKNTIARIRTPEYSNSVNLLKDELGLSMLINPEALTANQIARALSIPSAMDATTFLKGRVQLVSFKVKENSPLDKATVSSISKKVKIYTRREYSHVSISLYEDLTKMYSFGRLNPYNPFSGGFVHEEIDKGTFKRFKKTKTKIYSLEISEEQYEKLESIIEQMKAKKNLYKFNVIGLLGIMLNVKIKREKYFYCAEFVKYVLEQSQVLELPELVKPEDFEKVSGISEIYRGVLREYRIDDN